MTAHTLHLDHLVVAARTLDEGAQYVTEALGVEPAPGGRHPGMRTHNRLLSLWGGQYLEIIACEPEATGDDTAEAANAADAAHRALAGEAQGAVPDAAHPAAMLDAAVDGAHPAMPSGAHHVPPTSQDTGWPARPRWFGLDDAAVRRRLERGPFLAHWVARVARPKSLVRWQQQYPQRIPPVLPMTRGTLAWDIGVPDDGALPAWQGAGDGLVPTLIQWRQAAHPSERLPASDIALKALRGFHQHAEPIAEHLRWLGAAHLIQLNPTLIEPGLVAEFDTPSGPRVLK